MTTRGPNTAEAETTPSEAPSSANNMSAGTDWAKHPSRTRLRRDEILSSATKLFAERGYEGTSMADLAANVGLRKASLFHHFASKDVLYGEVLDGLVRDLAESTSQAAQAPGTFWERLDVWNDALMDAMTRNPFAARLLVREVLDWGPVMQGRLADTLNTVLHAALDFVRTAQREGTISQEIPADQFVMSVLGMHVMPFAMARLIAGATGTEPFEAAFIEKRRAEVRAQVRALASAYAK